RAPVAAGHVEGHRHGRRRTWQAEDCGIDRRTWPAAVRTRRGSCVWTVSSAENRCGVGRDGLSRWPRPPDDSAQRFLRFEISDCRLQIADCRLQIMTIRLKQLGVVLVLSLVATGCAAGKAFRQGEVAARAGNLDEAVAAYRR